MKALTTRQDHLLKLFIYASAIAALAISVYDAVSGGHSGSGHSGMPHPH